MKVLIFDSDAATQELFSKRLKDCEPVFFNNSLTNADLAAHADARVVSLFVTSGFTAEQMGMLPDLACIVARSSGVDHIDLAHARARGIVVCNVPRYGQHTVAEFAFALILALSRKLPQANNRVRFEGAFGVGELEGFDLFGKTIGIIGTGAIGASVVSIARGFGMRVLMYDPKPRSELI